MNLSIAQTRVIEDSLVYNDPTVAKAGKWVGGVSADFYAFQVPITQYDSNFNPLSATQSLNMTGLSGYAGYDDFTLMVSYRQGSSTTQMGASSIVASSTPYQTEINLRYLATPLATKYFVPYFLVGYVGIHSNYLLNVTVNGAQENNFTNIQGYGGGLGGIIPLTDKWGFRIDERIYSGSVTTTSIIPSFNTSSNSNFYQTTLASYYNFTEQINGQLGLRTETTTGAYGSTNYGLYATIGYRF